MLIEVKRWWKVSKDDFSKAKILFRNKKYDGAIYYCQQSIEKGLKGIALQDQNTIKRIHDLVELGKSVGMPESLLSFCKEITLSYAYSRYPDIEEVQDLNIIAAQFIEYTKEIQLWIKERIST